MSNRTEVPKFLFVVGLPRCGKKLIRSLLDGHPEVLMWPQEFTYFVLFRKLAGNAKALPVSQINQELIDPLVEQYFEKSPDPSAPKGIWGGMDFHKFMENLNQRQHESMDDVHYLRYLFQAFQAAHKDYKNQPVKYYGMICWGTAIDWTNQDLIQSSRFIYAHRNMKDSYASIREKKIKRIQRIDYFFNPKAKKSALYYMEICRTFSNIIRQHFHQTNFQIIALTQLQQDPKDTVEKIRTFLDIEDHPTLFKLNLMGQVYQGNAQEKALNQGMIAPRSSQLKIPLCQFEEKMLGFLNLYFYGEEQEALPEGKGVMKIALFSAFKEIQDTNVSSGTNRYILLWRRLIILKHLLAIYCVLYGFPLIPHLIQYSEDEQLQAVKNPEFWKVHV